MLYEHVGQKFCYLARSANLPEGLYIFYRSIYRDYGGLESEPPKLSGYSYALGQADVAEWPKADGTGQGLVDAGNGK